MALDDNILSIDCDDDNENYGSFNEFLEESTRRKKNSLVNEIELMGNQYLTEIETKKKQKNVKKNKLIPYIINNSQHTFEELTTYSFEDVQNIYDEIKRKKRPAIIKFLHFIFNFD